jgi:uncharacterized protein YneF (UPF0154 family)
MIGYIGVTILLCCFGMYFISLKNLYSKLKQNVTLMFINLRILW